MIQRLQAALRALIEPPTDLRLTYKRAEDLKVGDEVLVYLTVTKRKAPVGGTGQFEHVYFQPSKTDMLSSRSIQSGTRGALWTWGWSGVPENDFMVRTDA